MHPKVHLTGDTAIAASWLPFAKKKLQQMVVHLGVYFHRKIALADVTIWLDSDGEYNQRILIEGKSGVLYEFVTFYNYNDEEFLVPLDAHFCTAVLDTSEDPPRLKGRNYRGRSVSDSDRDFATAKAGALFQGNYERGDVAFFQPWYQVPHTEDADTLTARQTEGYRDCRLCVQHKNRESRYFSMFYDYRYDSFYQFFGYSPATIRPNRKPKLVPFSLLSGDEIALYDDVTLEREELNPWTGSAGAVEGGFIICASMSGHDFVFEVYHKPTDQSLEFTAAKPSWVTGKTKTVWYFSPDGSRAVSVQYGIDLQATGDAAEPYQGICEVVFNPYLNGSGELECEVTSGAEIFYPSLQVFAVDYDMYDSRTIRAAIIKNYLSPWLVDGEDDSQWARALLGIMEITEFESETGAPKGTSHKILLHHGTWLRGGPGLPDNNLPVDEFAYHSERAKRVLNPSWQFEYSYDFVETSFHAMDLRNKSWVLMRYQRHRTGEGSGDYEDYFYREYYVFGEKKDGSYYQGATFPGAQPNPNNLPFGYTQIDQNSFAWNFGFAWEDDLVLASTHTLCSLQRFLHRNLANYDNFPIHPNRSYAVRTLGSLFRYNAFYINGVAHPSADLVYSPLEDFDYDLVAYAHQNEDGNVQYIFSTHYDLYNEAFETNYILNPDLPAIGTHGLWRV